MRHHETAAALLVALVALAGCGPNASGRGLPTTPLSSTPPCPAVTTPPSPPEEPSAPDPAPLRLSVLVKNSSTADVQVEVDTWGGTTVVGVLAAGDFRYLDLDPTWPSVTVRAIAVSEDAWGYVPVFPPARLERGRDYWDQHPYASVEWCDAEP